ncbi:MAG: hypothetical protein PHW04_19025 [Candidatus Wallbacteria bacterium]|nr:hypothetical protein [Candidatus Wallbacteria bacterium]
MTKSIFLAFLFLAFTTLYADGVVSADSNSKFQGKKDGNAPVDLTKAADDYRNEGKINYAGGFTLKQLIMQTCATKDTAMKAYQKVLNYYETIPMDDMNKWARNAALGQAFKYYPNFFPAEGTTRGEKNISSKDWVPFFEDSELSEITTEDNQEAQPAKEKLRGKGDEPSVWDQNTINPAGGVNASATTGAVKMLIEKFLCECQQKGVTVENAAKGVEFIVKRAGLNGAQKRTVVNMFSSADDYSVKAVETALGF